MNTVPPIAAALIVTLGTALAVGVAGLPSLSTRRTRSRWLLHALCGFVLAPIVCGMVGGYLGLTAPATLPVTCERALAGTPDVVRCSPDHHSHMRTARVNGPSEKSADEEMARRGPAEE